MMGMVMMTTVRSSQDYLSYTDKVVLKDGNIDNDNAVIPLKLTTVFSVQGCLDTIYSNPFSHTNTQYPLTQTHKQTLHSNTHTLKHIKPKSYKHTTRTHPHKNPQKYLPYTQKNTKKTTHQHTLTLTHKHKLCTRVHLQIHPL